jgi:hypothetical protein
VERVSIQAYNGDEVLVQGRLANNINTPKITYMGLRPVRLVMLHPSLTVYEHCPGKSGLCACIKAATG